jgi:hypothetical protein
LLLASQRLTCTQLLHRRLLHLLHALAGPATGR